MGSNWKTTKLLDHYDIRSGLSKPAKDFGSGYPFLTFKDVFYNYFTPDELGDLVQSNDKERENCSVKRGDVFLTRTSETMHELGMSCVALQDYENATFNGFCKRLRPHQNSELVPEYVGYYLRSSKFRQAMLAFSTMSTRASLNNEMIARLEISYPPKDEQIKIATILKNLDDKIALNRHINQTLEQMANELFTSWFVDFDPVMDNALDAGFFDQDFELPDELLRRVEARKAVRGNSHFSPLPDAIRHLFPTAFEECSEASLGLGGWVPNGWSCSSIYEVMDIIFGAPFKSGLFNDSGEGKPIIRIRDLKTGSPQIYSVEQHPKKTLITAGDIIVGMDAEFRATIWSGDDGYLNQRLFLAKPKGNDVSNLFMKYSLTPLLEVEERAQVGTTVAHLGKKDIDKFSMIVPNQDALAAYKKLSNSFLSKMVLGMQEINLLTKLRDTLLPKLISGELHLKASSPNLPEKKWPDLVR
ncbi:restriction modification system DNA specificity domain-containing protein [Klebsiella pneumoniae]|nr:restriction modification system DNA specificity domain-containing protein [Klebsiella pneumoniae]